MIIVISTYFLKELEQSQTQKQPHRLIIETKKVIFKKRAPFTHCISQTGNTEIDHAKDTDLVMPMYDLTEYRDNYSKTFGFLE